MFMNGLKVIARTVAVLFCAACLFNLSIGGLWVVVFYAADMMSAPTAIISFAIWVWAVVWITGFADQRVRGR